MLREQEYPDFMHTTHPPGSRRRRTIYREIVLSGRLSLPSRSSHLRLGLDSTGSTNTVDRFYRLGWPVSYRQRRREKTDHMFFAIIRYLCRRWQRVGCRTSCRWSHMGDLTECCGSNISSAIFGLTGVCDAAERTLGTFQMHRARQ